MRARGAKRVDAAGSHRHVSPSPMGPHFVTSRRRNYTVVDNQLPRSTRPRALWFCSLAVSLTVLLACLLPLVVTVMVVGLPSLPFVATLAAFIAAPLSFPPQFGFVVVVILGLPSPRLGTTLAAPITASLGFPSLLGFVVIVVLVVSMFPAAVLFLLVLVVRLGGGPFILLGFALLRAILASYAHSAACLRASLTSLRHSCSCAFILLFRSCSASHFFLSAASHLSFSSFSSTALAFLLRSFAPEYAFLHSASSKLASCCALGKAAASSRHISKPWWTDRTERGQWFTFQWHKIVSVGRSLARATYVLENRHRNFPGVGPLPPGPGVCRITSAHLPNGTCANKRFASNHGRVSPPKADVC